MKPLVILNPKAQSGKTGALTRELERVVTRYLGSIDLALTEHVGHASELAEAAALEGRDTVVAVGGDGTVHEVANGLLKAHDGQRRLPKLGVVGQGTGGDFRKSLGLQHRLDRYCQAIADGATQAIDVGRFSYRNREGAPSSSYFINILSVGMGGLVDEYVAASAGQFGGTIAYLAASARALLKSEVGVVKCTIELAGQQSERELVSRQVAICNGRFFGGGMEVAPMAKLDDGVFQVVSLGSAPKLRFALSSLSIYGGKHVHKPDVEIFNCDKIRIELQNEAIREIFPLDVDGEPLGTLPLDIELVPKALEVFVPPD